MTAYQNVKPYPNTVLPPIVPKTGESLAADRHKAVQGVVEYTTIKNEVAAAMPSDAGHCIDLLL